MGMLTTIPGSASPAERILARFNRSQLAGFIEVAISLLDATDEDPDVEPNGDEEGPGTFAYNPSVTPSQLPEHRDGAIALATEDDEEDDPDEEDNEDCCPAGDDKIASTRLPYEQPGNEEDGEPSPWTEWHTRGRHKIGAHGEEQCRTLGTPNMAHEDAEIDDPIESNGDETDTGNAEDEGLTASARLNERDGAGCPIADPADRDAADGGHCMTCVVDQTTQVSEGEAFHDLNGISLIRVPLPENDQ